MMPGRTQSPRPRPAARRSAASRRCWQIERSPGRSRVAASNAASAGSTLRLVGGIGVGEVRHQRDLVDLRQRSRRSHARAIGARARSRAGSCRCSSSGRRGAAGRSCAPPADRSAPRSGRRARGAGASRSRDRAPSKQPSSSRIGPRQPSSRNALGLGEVEQREAVGALQRGVDVGDAVAVGVGLDDRPDLARRPRRARATARLAARASRWTSASIGRGMAEFCQPVPLVRRQSLRAKTRVL